MKTWNPSLYDLKHGFVSEYGRELIEWLSPEPQERILDIGCGTGTLTNVIHQSGARVTGIDSSEEMIAKAKNRFPGLDLRVEDILQFQHIETYDAIFSNAVLHWVTDPEKAVRQMKIHLKSGGRIVLEFGGIGNVELVIKQLRQSLKNRGFLHQSSIEPWYFPSVEEYKRLLQKNGFKEVEAILIDRPTQLEDDSSGLADWLSMFGSRFFEEVPDDIIEEIRWEVQNKLSQSHFKNGHWHAYYKRLRVKAYKPA